MHKRPLCKRTQTGIKLNKINNFFWSHFFFIFRLKLFFSFVSVEPHYNTNYWIRYGIHYSVHYNIHYNIRYRIRYSIHYSILFVTVFITIFVTVLLQIKLQYSIYNVCYKVVQELSRKHKHKITRTKYNTIEIAVQHISYKLTPKRQRAANEETRRTTHPILRLDVHNRDTTAQAWRFHHLIATARRFVWAARVCTKRKP